MDNRPPVTSQEQVVSSTQMFSLSPGLYTVVVTENHFLNPQSKVALPALHIAPASFAGDGDVAFLTSTKAPWLSRIGDALAIRVSGGDAMLAFTSLKPSSQPDATIGINLQRIGSSGPAQAEPQLTSSAIVPSRQLTPSSYSSGDSAGQGVLRCEIVVHVQRYGDIRVSDVTWAGLQGRGNWIEAVSITPVEEISPNELEYKGLTADGAETPWISGGGLCGSRGKGMALTGIAIRLTGSAAHRFNVSYEGTFVSGARGGKGQNGSPLRSDRIGDALEALRVIVIEKRRDGSPERIF